MLKVTAKSLTDGRLTHSRIALPRTDELVRCENDKTLKSKTLLPVAPLGMDGKFFV